MRRLLVLVLLLAGWFLLTTPSMAAESDELAALQKQFDDLKSSQAVVSDTLWVVFAAILVFFMNLGFGCVESGFCRQKNCVNILSKNFIVFAAASIAFWFVGWGLMFGDGNPYFGTKGLITVSGPDHSPSTNDLSSVVKADINKQFKIDLTAEKLSAEYQKLSDKVDEVAAAESEKVKSKEDKVTVAIAIPGKGEFKKEYSGSEFYWGVYSAISWAGIPLWAKFFFQLVFAGTAATIVSGVVAERIKYQTFIVFIFLMTIFIYPIVGHWIWGGGWLGGEGFFDFAGSTVVHSVGGWAGLMGVIFLGPRIGKYTKDGKPNAIPGHNLTVATIGCFVLWFGWFGFNPGSTMAADPGAIARICVTTNIAAAAGLLAATFVSWGLLKKPDLGMTLNGCLAGLVAITAPCACVTPGEAALIGAVGGALVVFAVLMIDRIRIDDPVGALSVHLVNGIWGTLAVGLFGHTMLEGSSTGLGAEGLLNGGGIAQLWPQILGIVTVGLYVMAAGAVVWVILKATMGLRVTPEEEIEGLDIGEHGNEAYPGFVMAAEMDAPQVAYEIKSASVPPPSAKRYEVTVTGLSTEELSKLWSKICQPNGHEVPQELKAVYPFLTTIKESTFRFRGGEPEQVRDNLQKLLQSKSDGGTVETQLSA